MTIDDAIDALEQIRDTHGGSTLLCVPTPNGCESSPVRSLIPSGATVTEGGAFCIDPFTTHDHKIVIVH